MRSWALNPTTEYVPSYLRSSSAPLAPTLGPAEPAINDIRLPCGSCNSSRGSDTLIQPPARLVMGSWTHSSTIDHANRDVLSPPCAGPACAQSGSGSTRSLWRSLQAASTTVSYAGPPREAGWPPLLWDTQQTIQERQAQAASPFSGLCCGSLPTLALALMKCSDFPPFSVCSS